MVAKSRVLAQNDLKITSIYKICRSVTMLNKEVEVQISSVATLSAARSVLFQTSERHCTPLGHRDAMTIFALGSLA